VDEDWELSTPLGPQTAGWHRDGRTAAVCPAGGTAREELLKGSCWNLGLGSGKRGCAGVSVLSIIAFPW